MKITSENKVFARLIKAKNEGIADTSGFWEDRSWARRGRAPELFLEFLLPHSIEYFHPMRPVFVLLPKNEAVLAQFSPLLVRDGALALLHFFYHHPKPSLTQTTLLIPNRLRYFVPEAWVAQSALYFPVSKRDHLFEPDRVESFVFILTLIDEKQASLEWLAAEIEKIRCWTEKRPSPVQFKCLVFYSGDFQVRSEHFEESSGYTFKMISSLQSKLGHSVEFVSLSEIRQESQERTVFIDVNELGFYYADSFVVHELLRRGARDFLELNQPCAKNDLDASLNLPVSLAHEFRVYPHDEHEAPWRNRVMEALESFRTDPVLALEEPSYPYESAFKGGRKLCSAAFETMVYELAHELKIKSIARNLSRASCPDR